MTTTEMMRYEISWENANASGSRFVLAESEGKAFERFDGDWSDNGDEVPSRWVSGQWAVA
jgi:hypothetical protein